jgi:hypothetical protein
VKSSFVFSFRAITALTRLLLPFSLLFKDLSMKHSHRKYCVSFSDMRCKPTTQKAKSGIDISNAGLINFLTPYPL